MKTSDLFDFGKAFHNLSRNQIDIIDGLRRNNGKITGSWGNLARVCGFPDSNGTATKQKARELERAGIVIITTETTESGNNGLREIELVKGWETNLLNNAREIRTRHIHKGRPPRMKAETEQETPKKRRGRPRKTAKTAPES